MARKSFRIQVELEIQSVTCPGVWLCPNGKVSLQVYMLDSCIQTAPLAPVFPLFIDERFVFYKTFASINKLVDLQRTFNREHLYAELIQWQDCEMGNVLSTFETSLTDLLFPSSCDVDLLMEPTRNYPGIISPKIEICTKTTIDEVCTMDKCKPNSYVVNPKTISSQQCRDACPRQQKKVCHSVPYHRQKVLCGKEKSRQNQPQFFSTCKPDDSLILRKPQGIGPSCSCDGKKKARKKPLKRFPQTKLKTPIRRSCADEEFLKCLSSIPNRTQCGCADGHEEPSCRICESYKRHFDNLASPCPATESVDELRGKITTENRSREDVLSKLKSEIEQDIDQLMCARPCTQRNFFSNQMKTRSVASNEFGKRMSTQFCCKPRRCVCPKNMRKKLSSKSIWERKNFVGKYSPKCKKDFKKVIPSIKSCKAKNKREPSAECYKIPPCCTKQTFCDRISPHGSMIENMECNLPRSKSCQSMCCDSPLNLDIDDDDECNALISKYCPQKELCPKDNNNTSSSWFSPKINLTADNEMQSQSLGLDVCFGKKSTSSEPRFSSFCVQNVTNNDTENPFNLKNGKFFCNKNPTDIPNRMEQLNCCKSLCKFDSKKAARGCLSDTCNTVGSRTHPFQKQIESRSKSPCLKADRDTVWCPYYGTPCSSNKFKDRIKTLTDMTQDGTSRSNCAVANNCPITYYVNDSDDCDNDNASSLSTGEEFSKYEERLSDKLKCHYQSLHKKIQSNSTIIRRKMTNFWRNL
ncbi:uncharacterized protein LOC112904959 isoform X2 [Agrilus planipennis]|uniref:Uncharacterized protein LOC112904959 isoform X2 n=1 Tax=Agrilus planipennis TaxID=224129 RepID=A0A7F5R813_AGRPL|nr:uncharacterized protein LOC112904959 isoform X2 [Agrilus planipennis]